MDGNKKITRKGIMLFVILIALYSCKVYNSTSIALYEADATDSITTIDVDKITSCVSSNKDSIISVKYIVNKSDNNDSLNINLIEPTLQNNTKSGVINQPIKLIDKSYSEDSILSNKNVIVDSLQTLNPLDRNSNQSKEVIVTSVEIKKLDNLRNRSVVGGTSMPSVSVDSVEITKGVKNIHLIIHPVSNIDSTNAISVDSILKLNNQMLDLKKSNKLLADSIAIIKKNISIKPKVEPLKTTPDNISMLNSDSLRIFTRLLASIQRTNLLLADSVRDIKNKPLVVDNSSQFKSKSDSLILLKKELEVISRAKVEVKEVPIVQTITSIISTPIINTDSILELNQELSTLKKSNKQLSDIIATLDVNEFHRYFDSRLGFKTDSIVLSKKEFDLFMALKSIASKTEVLDSIVTTGSVSDSIDSMNNVIKIQKTCDQGVSDAFESGKSISPDLVVNDAFSKKNISLKSDNENLLKMKSDSLNQHNVEAEKLISKVGVDSLEMEISLNEGAISESLRAIKLKSDSILFLGKTIDELRKYKEEKKIILSDKIQNRSDTVVIVAYYSSGSLIPTKMDEISTKLKENLNSNSVISVLLVGYADISGSSAINKRITTKRLDFIRKNLISLGYDKMNIFAQNWGSSYASQKQNELDRKVEIYILLK